MSERTISKWLKGEEWGRREKKGTHRGEKKIETDYSALLLLEFFNNNRFSRGKQQAQNDDGYVDEGRDEESFVYFD